MCEDRKRHPKVRLSSTEESCRVKRCPTPSVQFYWWTSVDSLLRSSWVVLTLSSGSVFTQPHKLSWFLFQLKMLTTQWCFGWLLWLLFLFSLQFIKYVRTETFNKILQHLYIYTEFCLLCQVLLMLGDLNSLTHSHWALQSYPRSFCWGSKLTCRAGFFSHW